MTVIKDQSESIHIANASIESIMSYELVEKWQDAHDTCRLRFALPDGRELLGVDPTLPTCISVQYNGGGGGGGESGEPVQVLKKSYSPISHPNQKGTFDLLVKSYPLRDGGGVGAYLCGLTVGDSIQAAVKPKRIMHLDAHVLGRWQHVGLVAGGTGIAPLYQMAKILLEEDESGDKDANSGSNDNDDERCQIKLLSIHRTANDILLRKECDELAAKYPHRFQVTYSLTGGEDNNDYDGPCVRDRGSVELVQKVLPDPDSEDGECMVFVCGKDGFVSHWGGPVARGPPPPGKQKKGPKVQGPLLGILKEAGYESYQVFKY
jgi:cytochrome-b5 reductase